MAGIFTSQDRSVNTGAQPKKAVPQEGLPTATWGGSIPIEDAIALSKIPSFAKNPEVQELQRYQAEEAEIERANLAGEPVIPSAQHQADTAAFQNEAYGSRATPSFSGAPDATINRTLEEVGDPNEVAELERREVEQDVIGVSGETLPKPTVDELIEQQTRKEAQTARQNNLASRISIAEDMDSAFKEQGYPLATRERKVALVTNMMDKLAGVSHIDSRTNQEENGAGRIVNRLNEGISDVNQIISPAAMGMALDQVLMKRTKILSGKANREALPDNSSPLDKILDLHDVSAVADAPSGTSAFASQEGLVGIKTGTLGSGILAELGDVIKQARGADQATVFDKNDGRLLELALQDAGLLVEGKYIVRNSKGKATEKNKELAVEHDAQFMTRKLFDAARDNSQGNAEGINDIRLGATSVTTTDGRAVGEYSNFTPSGKSKVKGSKSQREGATDQNVFTDYEKVRRKSFRTYDAGVLKMQGIQISALQTYLNTPPDQRANLPEMVQTLAKDMAIHHKIKKIELLDPRATDKKSKLKFFNANQKIGNVAKNIADASNLLESNPEGHRLGEAIWTDVTTQRSYPTAFNSNEHNKSMRSALRGHDRLVSRGLLEGKRGNQPLISEAELKALHNFFEKGETNMSRQKMEEIAFVFSYGRHFIPNSATIPDLQLLELITKDNLKQFADHSAAFEALSELASIPQNIELMKTNPDKLVLDPKAFQAVEQQVSPQAIKKALALATEIDPKAPGQTQQAIKSLSDYLNAGDGVKSVKTHMLNLADMSSASRLQPALHAGSAKGAQLISYMGYYITESAYHPESNQPVIDGVDYTTQNPRWFTVKNSLDALDSLILDMRDKGESGETQLAIAEFMTDALQDAQKAPEYADTIAKLGNMVLEYGRGLQGSTQAMLTGFDDFHTAVGDNWKGPREQNPAIILSERLNTVDATGLDVKETLSNIFSTSLLEVANLGYAQATGKIYEAASMLNISAVTVGMDGQLFPVGSRGRKPVFGETVVLRNNAGQETVVDAYGDVQDLPAEAAEAKFIEGEGYNDPLPYSKVKQASVPARGHITERSIMSDALKKQQEVLGEHKDILMDIHDAEGMAPLEAMAFEYMVQNKSVPEVLRQDSPTKDAREMDKRIRAKLGYLLSQDSMTMGPNSEYAELTVWLDRKYDSLVQEDAVSRGEGAFNDPAAKKRLHTRLQQTANMLRHAQENKLWAPKVGRTVLGSTFRTGDNANRSSFSVKPKDFAEWYAKNVLKNATSSVNKELASKGNAKENLLADIESIDPTLISFMRFGRDRAKAEKEQQ